MVMNVQDRGVLPEEMRYTYSVCPVCLKRIPAKREERDGQIYLVKTCPEHGTFSSVIWRNKRKFADWRGERPAVGENENLNCPAGAVCVRSTGAPPAVPCWRSQRGAI